MKRGEPLTPQLWNPVNSVLVTSHAGAHKKGARGGQVISLPVAGRTTNKVRFKEGSITPSKPIQTGLNSIRKGFKEGYS